MSLASRCSEFASSRLHSGAVIALGIRMSLATQPLAVVSSPSAGRRVAPAVMGRRSRKASAGQSEPASSALLPNTANDYVRTAMLFAVQGEEVDKTQYIRYIKRCSGVRGEGGDTYWRTKTGDGAQAQLREGMVTSYAHV